MIENEKFYVLADRSRVLGAVVGIWGPILFFGPKYLGWQVAAILLFAVAKEGIYDELCEPPDERGSGWRDFLGYFLGVAISVALYLIFGQP